MSFGEGFALPRSAWLTFPGLPVDRRSVGRRRGAWEPLGGVRGRVHGPSPTPHPVAAYGLSVALWRVSAVAPGQCWPAGNLQGRSTCIQHRAQGVYMDPRTQVSSRNGCVVTPSWVCILTTCPENPDVGSVPGFRFLAGVTVALLYHHTGRMRNIRAHDFERLRAVSLARCRSRKVTRLPTFPPSGGLGASAGHGVVSEASTGAAWAAPGAARPRMNASSATQTRPLTLIPSSAATWRADASNRGGIRRVEGMGDFPGLVA